MYQQFQVANRECSHCQRKLLGEYSGRNIPWGNAIYRIREFLGGGGMGEVYRAIEQDNAGTYSRETAVKFNKNTADPEIVKRFQLEVRVLNLLQNPHNIRVYTCGELYEERAAGMEVSAQFMVMELLRGQPLNDIIKQNSLTIQQAIPIFTQVCSALSEAHQKGIIHRDLKPHNIMLQDISGEYFPKVFDFGLSRVTNSLDDRLSTTGVVMGTFRYMSPEQALGEDVDQRTDIFSIGVVLYEVLCGQHPFPAKNLFELFTLHQQAPPPIQSLPPELVGIIFKALAYEQNSRYQNIDELREHLQIYMGDNRSGRHILPRYQTTGSHTSFGSPDSIGASQSSASSRAAQQDVLPSANKSQFLWIALTAVLILLVGVSGFILLRSTSTPSTNTEQNNKLSPQDKPKDREQKIAAIPTSPRIPQTPTSDTPPNHALAVKPPVVRTDIRETPVSKRELGVKTTPHRGKSLKTKTTHTPRHKGRWQQKRPSHKQTTPTKIRERPIAPTPPPDPTPSRIAMVTPTPPPLRVIPTPPPPRVTPTPPPPRVIPTPPPRLVCPEASKPIRYNQLDQALGRRLDTRISRLINNAANATIYDAGLMLSQSWRQAQVISRQNHMNQQLVQLIDLYCRKYKPQPGCGPYRATAINEGDRTLFVCKR
jgi:serine/threonine protein kinase